MNGMKRLTVLFLINLLIATWCFSQTTSTAYPIQLNDSLVIITTEQLKKVNLVFVEHEKLSKENVKLYEKIDLQQQMITNYQTVDSLRLKEKEQLTNKINMLQSDIKKKSRASLKKGLCIGGGIGIALTSLLFVLL